MEDKLSPTDLKIINYLLDNDIQNYNRMAKATGIPASTIYDRLRNMRRKGTIRRLTPVLDHEKLGYRVFAALEIETHDMRGAETLKDKYLHKPCVCGLFKMSGSYDILMLVMVKAPTELEKLITQMLSEPEVRDIHGSLAMHTYKFSQNPGEVQG